VKINLFANQNALDSLKQGLAKDSSSQDAATHDIGQNRADFSYFLDTQKMYASNTAPAAVVKALPQAGPVQTASAPAPSTLPLAPAMALSGPG